MNTLNTRTTTSATTPKAYNFALRIQGGWWNGEATWEEFASAEDCRNRARHAIYKFLTEDTKDGSGNKRTFEFITRGQKKITRITVDRTTHSFVESESENLSWR